VQVKKKKKEAMSREEREPRVAPCWKKKEEEVERSGIEKSVSRRGQASKGTQWTYVFASLAVGGIFPRGLDSTFEHAQGGEGGQLLDVQRIHVSPKSLFFWQFNIA
jgi:hypothetical protein